MCVRVGVRYVITKFSRLDSLPNFLTYGALLRARESSAIKAIYIISLHNFSSLFISDLEIKRFSIMAVDSSCLTGILGLVIVVID